MMQAPAPVVSMPSRRLDTALRPRQVDPVATALSLYLSALPDYRAHKFDMAIHAILCDQDLSPGSKLLAITIAHCNRLNPRRLTLARLAEQTSLTPRSVIRHLRELEEAGVLKITRGRGTIPSRYCVMVPTPRSA